MKNTLIVLILVLNFIPSINSQATTIGLDFFNQADIFLNRNVKDNGVNYSSIQGINLLDSLIKTIETVDISTLDTNTKKAFYINAYNLLVIKAVLEVYPIPSVLDVNGFFDKKNKVVAGETLSLNELEKEKLLKTYNDPRFHFVLVCGAIDCPPITPFAYRPNQLEAQLEKQTHKALNNPNFIKTNAILKKTELSSIFDWYQSDFGGSKAAVLDFINNYRINPIPTDTKISYYNYDWSLNKPNFSNRTLSTSTDSSTTSSAANAARYVVSSAIPKGTTETKIFNNLYSQTTNELNGRLTQRSSFFTSSVSFLYGLTNRINGGFDLRYRRVSNSTLPSSPLDVLGNPTDATNRQGITTIGPKVRIAPIPSLQNFSIQSAYWLAIGEDLEGTSQEPYIDWNKATWVTQFFNDKSIGSRFSLFTEVDIWWEDIGDLNRISTPATVIFSYFPNSKTTLYALASYSPYWQENYDYFAQLGLGVKYQISPNFEIELLYTDFNNKGLQANNGQAATYNIGFRYSK